MKEMKKLIRRLKGRARWQTFLDWLSVSLLCAFCIGTVFSVAYLIFPFAFRPAYIVWGSIAAAVLVSASAALAKRYDSGRILARADIRLGHKARLITAFELEAKHSPNPFRSLIVDEAAKIAEASDRKEAFPVAFPKSSGALPLFFLLFLASTIASFTFAGRTPDPDVQSAGELLESYGRTLAVRAEEDDLTESLRIAREMEKLGRLLRQGQLNQERVNQELRALSDRIERQIEGISREQNPESSESGGGASTSEPDTPTAETIDQLRQELTRQGSLTDEEARFLEETKKELDNPKGLKSMDSDSLSRLSDLTDRSKRSQETSALESAERTLREAMRALGDSPLGTEALADGAGEPADGAGEPAGGDDDTPESGDTNSGSESRTAGELAVEDEMTDDFERLKMSSELMVSELDGKVSGMSEVMKDVVRNLPGEAMSLLPTEEVALEYSRRLEETINSEEIPVGLRNYIRDYFLEIGLKKGEE